MKMPNRMHSWPARASVAVLLIAAVIVGVAGTATAHDPIFLTDEQTSPETGPYLPDGTISWAIYGSLEETGETRGFEFDLRDGDELFMQLMIPNVEPELGMAEDEWPVGELSLPDGEVMVLEPAFTEVFDEEFSGTSYVIYSEIRQPAEAGRHKVVISGSSPARFAVAVGETEEFFTLAERTVDRPESFPEIAVPLNAWYSTPAGAESTDGSDAESIEIDVEAMEAELEAIAAEEEAAAASEEATESAQSESPTESATPQPTASPSAEPDESESESAAAPANDSDDGTNLSWVAPVAIGLVAAIGLGFFFYRRRAAD